MKSQTERAQILAIVETWKSLLGKRTDGEKVQRQLEALALETVTLEQVDAITAPRRLVSPRFCDECGVTSYEVVMLGEEPDWESATAYVCQSCLEEALGLLKGGQ